MTMMSWSTLQFQVVAILPKLTALLSLCAQIWIVAEVLHSKKKRGSIYHRLLAGMSISSVLRSLAFFASTWPLPDDYPFAYANVGSETSCRIQGFVIQFGLLSPVYMVVISVYYWLTILYGWAETRMQSKEIFLHLIPWTIGLGTALAGLMLDLYHPAGFYCWIAEEPDDSANRDNATSPSTAKRPSHSHRRADMYRLVLYYGPTVCCFGLLLWFLGSIYVGMRQEEIRTLKYRHPHLFSVPSQDQQEEVDADADDTTNHSNSVDSNGDRSGVSRATFGVFDSKQSSSVEAPSSPQASISLHKMAKQHPSIRFVSLQVASQVVRYAVGFFFSHYAGALYRLLEFFNAAPYGFLVVMALFDPLQGFFDFCVYRRPLWLRFRRKYPEASWWTMCWATIQWPGIEGQGENPSSFQPTPVVDDDSNYGVTSSEAKAPEDEGMEVVPSPAFVSETTSATSTNMDSCYPAPATLPHDDPFGALDDNSSSGGGDDNDLSVFETERLDRLRQIRTQQGIIPGIVPNANASATTNSSSYRGESFKLAKYQQPSLPKINEDEEMQVPSSVENRGEDDDVAQGFLGRVAQLELLADLDIIEEVPDWVSPRVRQRIHRQMSMPLIRSHGQQQQQHGDASPFGKHRFSSVRTSSSGSSLIPQDPPKGGVSHESGDGEPSLPCPPLTYRQTR